MASARYLVEVPIPPQRITVEVPSQLHQATIEICILDAFASRLVEEIASDLNRHGTTRQFGLRDPSIQQLTHHYLRSGAFQQFLAKNSELINVTDP